MNKPEQEQVSVLKGQIVKIFLLLHLIIKGYLQYYLFVDEFSDILILLDAIQIVIIMSLLLMCYLQQEFNLQGVIFLNIEILTFILLIHITTEELGYIGLKGNNIGTYFEWLMYIIQIFNFMIPKGIKLSALITFEIIVYYELRLGYWHNSFNRFSDGINIIIVVVALYFQILNHYNNQKNLRSETLSKNKLDLQVPEDTARMRFLIQNQQNQKKSEVEMMINQKNNLQENVSFTHQHKLQRESLILQKYNFSDYMNVFEEFQMAYNDFDIGIVVIDQNFKLKINNLDCMKWNYLEEVKDYETLIARFPRIRKNEIVQTSLETSNMGQKSLFQHISKKSRLLTNQKQSRTLSECEGAANGYSKDSVNTSSPVGPQTRSLADVKDKSNSVSQRQRERLSNSGNLSIKLSSEHYNIQKSNIDETQTPHYRSIHEIIVKLNAFLREEDEKNVAKTTKLKQHTIFISQIRQTDQMQNSQIISLDSGSKFIVQISIFYQFIHQTSDYVTILIFNDITTQFQLSMIQQQVQHSQDILSEVAHEMRTPLNCIIGMLDVSLPLVQMKIKDQFLNPALSNARVLSVLIHDLLDDSQNNHGQFSLILNQFSLKDTIQQVFDLMKIMATNKNIKFQKKVHKSIPKIVKSDQMRFRQVLINLIGNAIKFTTEGSITVELSPYKSQLILEQVEIEKYIIVQVIDTGKGIKKDDQKKLFQQFGKLDDVEQMNQKGVGLGLMISNKIANYLSQGINGLQIDSQGQGKGSTLSFIVYDFQESEEDFQKQSSRLKRYVLDHINESYNQFSPTGFEITTQQQQLSIQRNEFLELIINKHESIENFRVDKSSDNSQDYDIGTESDIEEQTPATRIPSQSKNFFFPSSGKSIPNQKKEKEEETKEIRIQNMSEPSPCCQNPLCNSVLIVDDSYFNCLTLGLILQSFNITNEFASGGKDCQALVIGKYTEGVCCQQYQIIFLDIEMPDQNGIKTAINIKKFFRENQITTLIIACTGYSDEKEIETFYSAGMDGYLLKPVEHDKIKLIIDQVYYEDIQLR